MSMSATRSRIARCSAATASNQLGFPNEFSSRGSIPGGANQLGRSHPNFCPNTARRALSVAYRGEVRTSRAESCSSYGQDIP
jgi:hypothetical protein